MGRARCASAAEPADFDRAIAGKRRPAYAAPMNWNAIAIIGAMTVAWLALEAGLSAVRRRAAPGRKTAVLDIMLVYATLGPPGFCVAMFFVPDFFDPRAHVNPACEWLLYATSGVWLASGIDGLRPSNAMPRSLIVHHIGLGLALLTLFVVAVPYQPLAWAGAMQINALFYEWRRALHRQPGYTRALHVRLVTGTLVTFVISRFGFFPLAAAVMFHDAFLRAPPMYVLGGIYVLGGVFLFGLHLVWIGPTWRGWRDRHVTPIGPDVVRG